MGLVPLLNGREVVELTRDAAAISRGSGGVLTYRRSTVPETQVVGIWRLLAASPHLLPEAF